MLEKQTTEHPLQQLAGALGLKGLEETLASGRMIHILSLGLVITPDGDIKEVKDMTPEERTRNPHIQ